MDRCAKCDISLEATKLGRLWLALHAAPGGPFCNECCPKCIVSTITVTSAQYGVQLPDGTWEIQEVLPDAIR